MRFLIEKARSQSCVKRTLLPSGNQVRSSSDRKHFNCIFIWSATLHAIDISRMHSDSSNFRRVRILHVNWLSIEL